MEQKIMVFNYTKKAFCTLFDKFDDIMYFKGSPVYKKIGLDKIVKKSESLLGKIDDRSRAQVETGYVIGTGINLVGILGNEPLPCLTFGSITYILSLLHHSAMSDILKENDKLLRESEESLVFQHDYYRYNSK